MRFDEILNPVKKIKGKGDKFIFLSRGQIHVLDVRL